MQILILYIILGFFLGFFIIYLTTPPPKIILKYPTIENIQTTTYVDENGQCYKYFAQQIPCQQPMNSTINSAINY